MATSPKYTDADLKVYNNTYAVRGAGELLYAYYPISVMPRNDQMFSFVKSPPILADGVAIINKKFYDVSEADLLRRRIFVSKCRTTTKDAKTKPGKNTAKAGESSNGDDTGSTSKLNEEVRDSNEPGSEGAIEREITEAANLAWEKQIGTLLETIHPEEGEWEITSAPQSRRPRSSSTI